MCEDLVADVERALKGDAVISCVDANLKGSVGKGLGVKHHLVSFQNVAFGSHPFFQDLK
jgi:hypothetical protein